MDNCFTPLYDLVGVYSLKKSDVLDSDIAVKVLLLDQLTCQSTADIFHLDQFSHESTEVLGMDNLHSYK